MVLVENDVVFPRDLAGMLGYRSLTRNGIPWYLYCGDAFNVLRTLPKDSVNCVVTSPPYYWLRDYNVEGQIGQEGTVLEYVVTLSEVMKEVFRVLNRDGVLFLNLGDTYYSGKGEPTRPDEKSRKRRFGLRAVDKSGGVGIGVRAKTALGIPWRVAIEMCRHKWILRSDIIWDRKYSLPEPVDDRPRRRYEHIFMFVKDRKYFFDRQKLVDIGEEDIWTVAARPEQSSNGIDTAPFPDELVKRCLDIGCAEGGVVLDPFAGSGTTLRVALSTGRSAIGIDLNPSFCSYIVRRLQDV
jgi:DNA modification methylase